MPALAGRLMSQTISSTIGSRSASAAPSPRPTADVHQGIMWPMDPMPVEVTPTPMPVEVIQMPTDPANFWLGLIAAAGIFALANFPAWDRIVEAGKIDKEKGSMARLLFLTFGILAPFALLVRSLGALGENPVRTPGELEKVVLLLVFGAVIVVRASISQAPAAEATTNPTATVADQDPAPQSKRTRVTLRDTAWATLVAGAFLAGRRQR